MAGSYKHCVSEDGSFRFDLIENMGDAHEACEDMFTRLAEAEALLRRWRGYDNEPFNSVKDKLRADTRRYLEGIDG